MASVVSAGIVIGTTTRTKVDQIAGAVDARRLFDFTVDAQKELAQKEDGEGRHQQAGATMPQKVFSQFNWRIRMKFGMVVTMPGTISAAM
jgi:hypothetical protein